MINILWAVVAAGFIAVVSFEMGRRAQHAEFTRRYVLWANSMLKDAMPGEDE